MRALKMIPESFPHTACNEVAKSDPDELRLLEEAVASAEATSPAGDDRVDSPGR